MDRPRPTLNQLNIISSNLDASIAFYRRLGLERGTSSLNTGPEQARLDAVPNAAVEVTALTSVDGEWRISSLMIQNDVTFGTETTSDRPSQPLLPSGGV